MRERISWTDLPKKEAKFTKRNSGMFDLRTGEIVQCYSSNTRIDVVSYAELNGKKYYRTETAAKENLDLGLPATAFGEKIQVATTAHKPQENTSDKKEHKSGKHKPRSSQLDTSQKQEVPTAPKVVEEPTPRPGFLTRLRKALRHRR